MRKQISAEKVVFTSFVVDLLDILMNLTIAYFSGSVIMVAEALEGISDLMSSGLLFVGLHRSGKREDKAHPFGYGREIYFWTLISGLIMFGITSTFSIYFGFQRFTHPYHIHNINFAFGALIIALLTNGYAFFLSYKRLIHKRSIYQVVQIFYKSSLIETKTTFILDLMGTSSAVLGLLSLGIYTFTGDERFDGIGAIVIGVTLAFLSYFLLAGIKDLFVGKSASPEIEEKIKQAALSIPEVKEVLDLETLNIGTEKFLANIDLHVIHDLKTVEIERLIETIKDKIREVVPNIKHIQIELDTPRSG